MRGKREAYLGTKELVYSFNKKSWCSRKAWCLMNEVMMS